MTSRRRWFLAQLPFYGAAAAAAKPAPRSKSLRERMLAIVDGIEAVNTHEHTLPETQRYSMPVDFFTLANHYALADVVSAGLPRESMAVVYDQKKSLEERWRAFEPFWKGARFTGYCQALRIAMRDIYGAEQISLATLPRLNDAIRAQNTPGLYHKILKDRARIRYSVLDDYWNAVPARTDASLFVLARRFDRFIIPQTPDDIRKLEEITGLSITTLDGLRQAAEKSFQQSLTVGMVTVKVGLAYNRRIHFQEVDATEAAKDFEALMRAERKLPQGFRAAETRPYRKLEDHMFHHVIQLADAHRIPVQIHTGLQAGNGGFVANTNPVWLNNLFFLYPKVKFDLFHLSYPYQEELSALAKQFANVYVDFCWAHIISPTAAQRALHELLDTVPANKLLGFGGDYWYPELTYAHGKMARRNISDVLAAKIENGFCNEEEAAEIARLLLHDNPNHLFPYNSA